MRADPARDVPQHQRPPRHCDEYIEDPNANHLLRAFLRHARAPAVEQLRSTAPVLWATFNGIAVRCTMASKFGDIGINTDGSPSGYFKRVPVEELSDFRRTKELTEDEA